MNNKDVESSNLKAWKKEKELIPGMIKRYCLANHSGEKGELCEDCKSLTEYALFRLEMCPYKENKPFCSFCEIHCYKADMREKIKAVMRYSGPRMIFTHPVYALSHLVQMLKYKKMLKDKKCD